MERCNIIDMHCDTLTAITDSHKKLRDNGGHLSLAKMQTGQYLMQCMAVFIFLQKGQPYQRCNSYIDSFNEMMAANKDMIRPVTTIAELKQAASEGLMGALLTIEEGGVLQGDISNLLHFYNRGVRMMTLTWNFENEIGYPNDMKEPPFHIETVNGLKPFGKEVVSRMNELGMIVDVSHLGDAGFYDVLAASSKPFVASHSNSRAVCDIPRNMTDDMIRHLAKAGGVMGLNYCADFVNQDRSKTVIPGLVDHARHIAEVGGIEVLALGSDFDGIGDLDDLSGADKIGLLIDALRESGFTADDINKITHENFLRVWHAQNNS